MKQGIDLKIGLVPIARPTFDITLAEAMTTEVRQQLAGQGFQLVGPETLVTGPEEVREAARMLTGTPLDLLLIFQATFADSTMILTLAETLAAPLLLWAVPEAHTGGRLRLNSLCGINLAGHGLTRAGYHYDYLYAAVDDETALAQVETMAQAGRVRRLLRHTRLAQVGPHPAGFDTCRYDKAALRHQLGVEVVEVELQRVFQQVRATPTERIEVVAQRVGQRLGNLSQLDQKAVQGTLGTYVTLRQLADEERLAGLAIRCWPEFFTELGCAACGALSLLSDELTPCSCEADVNGTITQLILQWLSGEPAFGTDLVSIEAEADAAVVWHCGQAPLSMADPSVSPLGTVHSNRRLPLLMAFPLKPGRVTVARLSEATGEYRLVVGGGEMLAAPPCFSGTSGVLRFDRPVREVLDIILRQGLEHHVSITYGNHLPALLALAKMLDIPVLPL